MKISDYESYIYLYENTETIDNLLKYIEYSKHWINFILFKRQYILMYYLYKLS
jgi:hypothetical protein